MLMDSLDFNGYTSLSLDCVGGHGCNVNWKESFKLLCLSELSSWNLKNLEVSWSYGSQSCHQKQFIMMYHTAFLIPMRSIWDWLNLLVIILNLFCWNIYVGPMKCFLNHLNGVFVESLKKNLTQNRTKDIMSLHLRTVSVHGSKPWPKQFRHKAVNGGQN